MSQQLLNVSAVGASISQAGAISLGVVLSCVGISCLGYMGYKIIVSLINREEAAQDMTIVRRHEIRTAGNQIASGPELSSSASEPNLTTRAEIKRRDFENPDHLSSGREEAADSPIEEPRERKDFASGNHYRLKRPTPIMGDVSLPHPNPGLFGAKIPGEVSSRLGNLEEGYNSDDESDDSINHIGN